VTIARDGRKQTFQIVGEDEADPSKGKISYVSPLARAIMNKEVGVVQLMAKDSSTYLFAPSNVIISLRVTVTNLVVTGGPPPAICQAA
jgi:Transcription elongation factor, GreA/GreB, C-term